MRHKTVMGVVFAVVVQGLAGCDRSRSSIPSAPSPVPSAAPQPAPPQPSSAGLIVFTEQASGFTTTDLHDADEQIVQFTTTSELIWTADGTRLSGYGVQGNSIAFQASCQCSLVVRYGARNGERRAYLTADYIHDNPGTLVDLAIAGGVLVVNRTDVFPPGTYTLSGLITEVTETGQASLENAGVWRLNEEKTGWQVGTTDKNGFYEIHGLNDGSRDVSVIKEGYETVRRVGEIRGDTRFDTQVVRR